MSNNTRPEYIDFLLSAASYPHPAEAPELVQTHISNVILAGDFVYKWKKNVNFGFLDFSTLARRKHFCEEEVRLNSRLCPDVYLDTTWISRKDGVFSLKGDGEIIEYGVKMRRMPEERMMSKVIHAGGLQQEHLAAIVDILVPFYQKADGSEQVKNNGTSKAVGKNVLDNFSETERFVGTPPLSTQQFAEIRAYATDFLARENIFNDRIKGGYIRDCHGDLHSGNICLEARPAIFDCIEFNENLRFTDVAADVAFLAMDLDFHQLPELSKFFIDRFIVRSGDQGIHQILNFYKCYRAYVRGKIGLLTSADPSLPPAAAQECANQAGLYFQLAHRYIK